MKRLSEYDKSLALLAELDHQIQRISNLVAPVETTSIRTFYPFVVPITHYSIGKAGRGSPGFIRRLWMRSTSWVGRLCMRGTSGS